MLCQNDSVKCLRYSILFLKLRTQSGVVKLCYIFLCLGLNDIYRLFSNKDLFHLLLVYRVYFFIMTIKPVFLIFFTEHSFLTKRKKIECSLLLFWCLKIVLHYFIQTSSILSFKIRIVITYCCFFSICDSQNMHYTYSFKFVNAFCTLIFYLRFLSFVVHTSSLIWK